MDALARTTLDASPSKHVLAVPVSDEQIWEMTSAFLAEGLQAGDQVAYYDDDGTGDRVVERLLDDGVDVDASIRSGQLLVVPGEVTRDALTAPLEALPALLQGSIDAALDAGWSGLRFTGNMSHGLTRPSGSALPEYDRIVDDVLADRPARALCMYDQNRFPAGLIERMRELHASEAGSPAIYDDALLRVTRGPGAAVRLAGEVDHSNRQQVRRLLEPMVDRTLRSPSGPTDIVLDVTSLRFCDVAAAVSVVHAAEEFPSSHRLVLTGARPIVARALERCGAEAAPQLVIHKQPRRD